jgi:hypothetical protein
MVIMLLISWVGAFGGLQYLYFPLDMIIILPVSIFILQLSQCVLRDGLKEKEKKGDMEVGGIVSAD